MPGPSEHNRFVEFLFWMLRKMIDLSLFWSLDADKDCKGDAVSRLYYVVALIILILSEWNQTDSVWTYRN